VVPSADVGKLVDYLVGKRLGSLVPRSVSRYARPEGGALLLGSAGEDNTVQFHIVEECCNEHALSILFATKGGALLLELAGQSTSLRTYGQSMQYSAAQCNGVQYSLLYFFLYVFLGAEARFVRTQRDHCGMGETGPRGCLGPEPPHKQEKLTWSSEDLVMVIQADQVHGEL